MLRAGVLLVICSGTRQGTQRRCRRWGECAGVGPALLRTRILGPVTQGASPGRVRASSRRTGTCSQAGGKNDGHGGAVPCWVRRESRTKPKPKQGLTQKGNGEETTLSGGYPRPVLSPSPPTWSRTGSGSGSGSEHTHLCQTASGTDNSVGTGLQTMGVSRFTPVGTCPSHLHVKVSPAAPNPPRSHGRFGRRTGSTWVAG